MCFLRVYVKLILNMRKKLDKKDKKQRISVSIDKYLLYIFEKYVSEKVQYNKNKYIEKLIKEDLINRNLLKDDDFIGLKNN